MSSVERHSGIFYAYRVNCKSILDYTVLHSTVTVLPSTLCADCVGILRTGENFGVVKTWTFRRTSGHPRWTDVRLNERVLIRVSHF